MKNLITKTKIFTGICLLLSQFLMAQSSFICFKSPANYIAGASPRAVKTSDFNNDGNADLAVANYSANSISILLGNGTGTLATAVNYTVGIQPTAIATADFNGDSKIDLAVSNYGSNNVSILLGSTTGTFGTPVNFAAGSSPQYVTSADFNNDGKIDLAVGNYLSNNISILMGSGTGTFSAPTNYNVGSQPISIRAADYNADSKIDLAVANFGTNNISILIGSGTGTFAAAVNYTTGSGPSSIISADFNTDGKLDLAVSNYYSNNIAILMGTGVGTFSSAINYTTGSGPNGITPADFNGDGKIDIASTNDVSNNLSILLGSTTGTFATPVNIAASTAWGITSADFNNDSKPDVAIGHFGGSGATVYINGQNLFTTSGSVCNGNSFLITPTGASTYTISGGLFNVTPTITTSYTILGTGTTGCTNTVISTVTVIPKPTIVANTGTVCSGSAFTLSATGAVTYSYSSVTPVVNPIATTSYTIIGTGANSCTNSAVTTITAINLPTITVNSGTICSGDTFTITPSGAITYTYSSGSSFVSPTSNNSYTVSGTNSTGCINSSICTISVNSVPNLTTSTSASTICIGGNATLNANGATTYSWSTGATTSSIVVSPTINTNYVVTGYNGLCNSTKTISINISNSITVVVGINNPTICIGQTAIITASGATTYTWDTGATSASISVSPTVTTTYTVNGVSGSCNGSAVSTLVVDLCTGIENYENGSTILLFPNPTLGIITIANENDSDLKINNILGQIVFESKLQKGINTVDLNELPNGIYYISLKHGNLITTKKLIKN